MPPATHPMGSSLVGTSMHSLAHMAESESRPLARLRSMTCGAGGGGGRGTGVDAGCSAAASSLHRRCHRPGASAPQAAAAVRKRGVPAAHAAPAAGGEQRLAPPAACRGQPQQRRCRPMQVTGRTPRRAAHRDIVLDSNSSQRVGFYHLHRRRKACQRLNSPQAAHQRPTGRLEHCFDERVTHFMFQKAFWLRGRTGGRNPAGAFAGRLRVLAQAQEVHAHSQLSVRPLGCA